jgi:2-oxoglutarate dehydrogenase E2 component (dihydrolipoamide succinyltransferase)
MILEMKVPSPGESIKEVEIRLVRWRLCRKDQAIAEVDSDKATLECQQKQAELLLLKQKKVML